MHAFNRGIKNIAARQILFITSSIHIISLSAIYTDTKAIFSEAAKAITPLSSGLHGKKDPVPAAAQTDRHSQHLGLTE